MPTVIRSVASRANFIVGPMVMLIGLSGAITAVVLALVLGTAWFLLLLFPAALALGAGVFVLWIARRARLELDEQGMRWCGFLGTEHALAWEQVGRIAPPPAGSGARTVAVALLRDGSAQEIHALWESPTSPAALLGAGSGHARELAAIMRAHQQYLAARR